MPHSTATTTKKLGTNGKRRLAAPATVKHLLTSLSTSAKDKADVATLLLQRGIGGPDLGVEDIDHEG